MCAFRPSKRILVVDNDPGVRKTTRQILESEGYEVYAAEGTYEDLIADATCLLIEHRCHLVILDLRLFSDNDPDDRRGLDLASAIAQQYPWTKCLLLTGHESFDLARKALGRKSVAVDIALKKEGPIEVLKMTDQVFNEHIRCCWDQHLEWAGGLSLKKSTDLLVHLDLDELLSESVAESELIEILGRLFPNADVLRISNLSDYGNSPSQTYTHSMLLRVKARQNSEWLEDVAVKLGRRSAILKEIENYDQHVDGRVGGFRTTVRRARTETWHLGGIVYALIGTELDDSQTLKDFYHQSGRHVLNDLKQVLHRLFGRLFRNWYDEPKTVNLNLWDEYSQALDLDAKRLERLKWGDDEQLEFASLALSLPNPLRWHERNALHSEVRTSRHVVHGDLHSRNVFIGSNKGVWLIDFERTGMGHCLRDYIELETDIKFSLMKLSDLRLYYVFEAALLGQDKDKLSRLLPPSEIRQHSEAARAFKMITTLRQLAASRIRYSDLRDYFWGLLCHTLFVATLSNLSRDAQLRVKLSAALICERLGEEQHLRRPWPPEDLFARQPYGATKKKVVLSDQAHPQGMKIMRSGGVDINAQTVNIGRDVSGRDTNTETGKTKVEKRRAAHSGNEASAGRRSATQKKKGRPSARQR